MPASVAQPLNLWLAPACDVDQSHLSAVVASFENVLALRETRWKAALLGDAAAAIGLVLDIVVLERALQLRRDLALSALWVCAPRGDSTARLTLTVLQTRKLPVCR